VYIEYKIPTVGDKETISLHNTRSSCRRSKVTATASVIKNINLNGAYNIEITTSLKGTCKQSPLRWSCRGGTPFNTQCNKRATITCYKLDGSTETVDGWNRNIKLRDCTRIKIEAKVTATGYGDNLRFRRVRSTISGSATISYHRHKEYLKIGCISAKECDDSNPKTKDKCENNICMHSYNNRDWFETEANLIAGRESYVIATIHNTEQNTNPFIVTLLIDDKPIAYKIINLREKESKRILFKFTPPGGKHILTLRANYPSNDIPVPEILYNNNILSREIFVKGSYEEVKNTPIDLNDILFSKARQRRLIIKCNNDRQCLDKISETVDKCIENQCIHTCDNCFPEIQNSINNYTTNPTNLYAGDKLDIETEIYNNGEFDAINFLVTLEDNDGIVDYRIISIEDNNKKRVRFKWIATPGEHNLSIKADPLPEPYGIINESNENNNIITTRINVKNHIDVIPSDLVAFWNLNEGSGNTAYDSSGNDNNGNIHGAEWTEGISGHALRFDGVDDYVEVPDDRSLEFSNSSFTAVVWIKTTYYASLWHNILGKDYGNCRENTRGWLLTYYEGKPGISIQSCSVCMGTRIDDGKWHQVAIQADVQGSVTYLRVYIDGELKREVSTTLNVQNDEGPLKINPSRLFNGIIDNIRIYRRALTPEEIRELYNKKHNTSLYLPVNPLSGSGESKESHPKLPPLPFTTQLPIYPLSILLMGTMAAALYMAYSRNTEGIRQILTRLVKMSRGIDIQNTKINPVIIDGENIRYINLDGVKTKEIVIKNIKQLQFIDLNNVEADKVIIENTNILGDINLRGAKIKEIIIRNTNTGGNLKIDRKLTHGETIRAITIENVNTEGSIDLHINAYESSAGNITLRNIKAKDSVVASLHMYDYSDMRNFTVEDITARNGLSAIVDSYYHGRVGNVTYKNINSGGRVLLKAYADMKNMGDVRIENIKSATNASIKIKADNKGGIKSLKLNNIYASREVNLRIKADERGRINNVSGNNIISGRNMYLNINAKNRGTITGRILKLKASRTISGKISELNGGYTNLTVRKYASRDKVRNIERDNRKRRKNKRQLETWMGIPVQYLSDEAKFRYYFGDAIGKTEIEELPDGTRIIRGKSDAGDKYSYGAIWVDWDGNVLCHWNEGYESKSVGNSIVEKPSIKSEIDNIHKVGNHTMGASINFPNIPIIPVIVNPLNTLADIGIKATGKVMDIGKWWLDWNNNGEIEDWEIALEAATWVPLSWWRRATKLLRLDKV
ncbi:MAG: hypothetical protein DRO92_03045, partial [Candidatus Altiarchaeales archaeon]